MDGVLVIVGVLFVKAAALVAWRWWLEFSGARQKAQHEHERSMAQQKVVADERELLELKARVREVEGRVTQAEMKKTGLGR